MRVASLTPSATEIVFVLGCGGQLIGRTAFCDFPPEARRIPSVGGWTTANVASVVALQPDLVLTSTFLQDAIVTALQENGVAVCHTDPRTLADVFASFETIAAALGIPDRGRLLRVQIEAALSSLPPALPREALAKWGASPLLPKVYAEEWHNPPMASGNWVPDLVTAVGGQSFLPAGERSRNVTLEEVQRFDPDIVVLNYCGMERIPAEKQKVQFLSRERWQELRAVRENRVCVLPDSLLNRPGPRLAEGARQLQHALAKAAVPV